MDEAMLPEYVLKRTSWLEELSGIGASIGIGAAAGGIFNLGKEAYRLIRDNSYIFDSGIVEASQWTAAGGMGVGAVSVATFALYKCLKETRQNER